MFTMGSGPSPSIGAQLSFRLLAGLAVSTPVTTAGGSLSDTWTASQRTLAFPLFAAAAFWGLILGPIAGGFIG